MRKRRTGKKLSRSRGARKALYRSLVRALVDNGSIQTTLAKAKFLQKRIEKLINFAKKGDLAGKKRVYSELGNDKKTAQRLIRYSTNFSKIKGGYTKIIKLPQRRGDFAQMALIKWSVNFVEPKADKVSKKSVKEANSNIGKGKIEKLKDKVKKVGKSKKNPV